MLRRGRTTGLLIFLVTSFPFAVCAQDRTPPKVEDLTLTESVDVRLVNVDVVVVDRKGNPVRGLKREDFVVREDGKVVEVTHFSVYEDMTGPEASEGVTEVAAGTSPELAEEPLLLVVYLDDQNISPLHRTRVLRDLESFLTDLAESEGAQPRVLLASHRSRVVVHGGLTDAAGVASLLSDHAKPYAHGGRAALERRATEQRIIQSQEFCETAQFCEPCVTNFAELLSFARDLAVGEETQVALIVSGLAEITSSLGGFSGRKAVLYVGDGFPQRPGAGMFSYLRDLCPANEREVVAEIMTSDETKRFNKLTAHANANRVQFYMLDSAGLRNYSTAGVQYSSHGYVPSRRTDDTRISNLQNSLFVIANETGGKAILNANRPKLDLNRMLDDFRSSYSLGFSPVRAPSGRVHLLDVELVGKAAKGRRVRFRRSYRDKVIEERLADELVAALKLGDTRNPLDVTVTVGSSLPFARKTHTVPVLVEFPGSSLTYVPGPLGKTAQIRVWLQAVDERGRRTSMRQQLINVDVSRQDSAEPISYRIGMELGEGSQQIAVGVRDEVTGTTSLLLHSTQVPTLGASESP